MPPAPAASLEMSREWIGSRRLSEVVTDGQAAGRTGEKPSVSSDLWRQAATVLLRDADVADRSALTAALLYAANWDDQWHFDIELLFADPQLRTT